MIELLKKLNTDFMFRPDDGAFRSKLAETVISNADEDCAELFSEHNCDILVSISGHTIEEGVIRYLVVSALGEQNLECALSVLNHDEFSDLEEQLSRQVTLHSTRSTHGAQKVIIRKNVKGMFCTHQAAQKLGCSQFFLKSKIPCTDYAYREVDGKKEINEYYWSINLIERLSQIKLNGAKTEDLKYVAEECCDGDCKWAEEILVSLGCPISTLKVDCTLPKGITKRPAKFISKVVTSNRPPRKKNP